MLSHKFAAWACGALLSVICTREGREGVTNGIARTHCDIIFLGWTKHRNTMRNFVDRAASPALVEDLVSCLSSSANFADTA